MLAGPNSWTGNSPLFPIMIYANNGLNPTYSGVCGYFRGVRNINMANYLPGDTITLGSDTWMVFPIAAKVGYIPVTYCTYNQGYAVLM
jgi:hypothetical protein